MSRADPRELRKLVKAQEAEQRKRVADYHEAKSKAESAAYRVLSRFMSGEEFPQAWVYYTPADDWSKHLFTPVVVEYATHTYKHTLNTQYGAVDLDHHGNDLVGAVCTGSGFCWLVFLRDRTTQATTCYAVAAHDGVVALADCPTILPEQFRNRQQEQADDAAA